MILSGGVRRRCVLHDDDTRTAFFFRQCAISKRGICLVEVAHSTTCRSSIRLFDLNGTELRVGRLVEREQILGEHLPFREHSGWSLVEGDGDDLRIVVLTSELSAPQKLVHVTIRAAIQQPAHLLHQVRVRFPRRLRRERAFTTSMLDEEALRTPTDGVYRNG